MPKLTDLERIQLMAAARKLWNNGHTPEEISGAMKRNVDTVRRWIKTTGVTDLRRRRE